jgi:hypothetical protein
MMVYLETLTGDVWRERSRSRSALVCLARARMELLQNYRIRDAAGALLVVICGVPVEAEA